MICGFPEQTWCELEAESHHGNLIKCEGAHSRGELLFFALEWLKFNIWVDTKPAGSCAMSRRVGMKRPHEDCALSCWHCPALVIDLGFLLRAAGWNTQMQEGRKGIPSALVSQNPNPGWVTNVQVAQFGLGAGDSWVWVWNEAQDILDSWNRFNLSFQSLFEQILCQSDFTVWNSFIDKPGMNDNCWQTFVPCTPVIP